MFPAESTNDGRQNSNICYGARDGYRRACRHLDIQQADVEHELLRRRVHGDRREGIGGLVGNSGGGYEIHTSYWDLDTSGITDPAQGACDLLNVPGITGLTDAQLKAKLPKGFDPSVWGQSPSINNGYPYLLANPPQ